MRLPIGTLRGLFFYSSATSELGHPWISALRHSVREDATIDEVLLSSHLRHYINRWNPRNAAERLGLDPAPASPLRRCPAWAIVLPWSPKSIEESTAEQANGRLHDTQQYGKRIPISMGSEAFGPSSDEVIEFCAYRLSHVWTQIFLRGLNPSLGALQVVELKPKTRLGKQSRFYIVSGQHRFAVYSSLRLSRVPCKVVAQVEEGNLSVWPAVLRGYFSRAEALDVFHRMHSALPPNEVS